MANVSFPQIPATVWWGIRALLQKTPSARFDDSMLAASLGVQVAAARQYLAELKRVGLLDEEGKATDLASKWRLEDRYEEAVRELVSGAYPDSLVTIAPPGDADRKVVKSWFLSQGLGEGSAGNKTATYLLISALEPGENSSTPAAAQKKSVAKEKDEKPKFSNNAGRKSRDTGDEKQKKFDSFPLNVNVQIHISADASPEQIDSIFQSMRKHLYEE